MESLRMNYYSTLRYTMLSSKSHVECTLQLGIEGHCTVGILGGNCVNRQFPNCTLWAQYLKSDHIR